MGPREVPARVARQGRARRDVLLPLGDTVTTALQGYADRGVFRGFTATRGAGGRVEYAFLWLFRRPTLATFDSRRGALRFPKLFPAVAGTTGLAELLDGVVAARTDRTQPAHKRLDGRRARLSAQSRAGDWSLVVAIRGDHHAYAVAKTLDAINECAVALHEQYPDYLIREFGASAE